MEINGGRGRQKMPDRTNVFTPKQYIWLYFCLYSSNFIIFNEPIFVNRKIGPKTLFLIIFHQIFLNFAKSGEGVEIRARFVKNCFLDLAENLVYNFGYFRPNFQHRPIWLINVSKISDIIDQTFGQALTEHTLNVIIIL